MAARSGTVSRRIAFGIALLAMLPAVPFSGQADASTPARIVIHAVVLAVDPVRNLVMLRSEAIETGPAMVRVCRLRNPHYSEQLTRGTVIEAVAETTHQPWVLESIRVRARTLMPAATTVI